MAFFISKKLNKTKKRVKAKKRKGENDMKVARKEAGKNLNAVDTVCIVIFLTDSKQLEVNILSKNNFLSRKE